MNFIFEFENSGVLRGGIVFFLICDVFFLWNRNRRVVKNIIESFILILILLICVGDKEFFWFVIEVK